METLNLSPIGYLKSQDKLKFAVPHQPDGTNQKGHIIELNPGFNFEAALRDLDGFERVWLIWWFNRNNTWRPCVMPPRGEAKRRGVFATRSPHRPNPIGITNVPLLGIKGRTIFVGDTDLIDGTPIFDIKPYISEIDSFPEAACGWLADVNQEYSAKSYKQIIVSPLAQRQLNWLQSNWQIDFFSQAKKILSLNPNPHRTRRITKLKDDNLRMGCGAWRIFFYLKDSEVVISHIAPGYPLKNLCNQGLSKIADREAQLAFIENFPESINA